MLDYETLIELNLYVPSFGIDGIREYLVWYGDPACASFFVNIPPAGANSSHEAWCDIYVNQMKVARVQFLLVTGPGPDEPTEQPVRTIPVRSAFASYSYRDLEAVLNRIQGIRAANPEMDVFLDRLSLKQGEEWKTKVEREIIQREIFYLFWSTAAQKSAYVEWEWRTALKHKGLSGINPIPLVRPEEAPPPEELKPLHFNDWTLQMR